MVPTGYNLSGDSPLIQFGEEIEYVCSEGRKFALDMEVTSQNATCLVNNTWEPSQEFWSACVQSENTPTFACIVLHDLLYPL